MSEMKYEKFEMRNGKSCRSLTAACSCRLPPASCLLGWRPAAALIRGASSIEHQLHAITVFEGGRALHAVATFVESSNECAGECREASRPTAFPHARCHHVPI